MADQSLPPKAQNRLLMMALGQLYAMKCAMSAVLGSHPDPLALKNQWHLSKAEWVDDLEMHDTFRSEDFRHAAMQVLGAFSQTVDEWEEITRPPSPDGA